MNTINGRIFEYTSVVRTAADKPAAQVLMATIQ